MNPWYRDDLTLKQKEYLALLASGLNTLEIADVCVVSHNTVRNTLVKAKERIGAESTGNLIAIAVDKGWIKKDTNEPPYRYNPSTN